MLGIGRAFGDHGGGIQSLAILVQYELRAEANKCRLSPTKTVLSFATTATAIMPRRPSTASMAMATMLTVGSSMLTPQVTLHARGLAATMMHPSKRLGSGGVTFLYIFKDGAAVWGQLKLKTPQA
jgi:hypothetical protein